MSGVGCWLGQADEFPDQVAPAWIEAFDQLELPQPPPLLDLALATEGGCGTDTFGRPADAVCAGAVAAGAGDGVAHGEEACVAASGFVEADFAEASNLASGATDFGPVCDI